MMQGAKHLLLNAVFTSREQAFCGKRFKTFDHHATAHFIADTWPTVLAP